MTALHPGFAHPVHDSQSCFRAVLDAMARPGTIQAVTGPMDPPPPLHRATAALLLTLVDAETPLWLDPAAGAAASWIGFHCAAPAAPRDAAAFALTLAPPDLDGLNPGTDDAPQDAATLIVQLDAAALAPGSAQSYRLEGPGLAAPTIVGIDGLPPGFVAQWARNRALFPRGVDLILCAGDRLAAFPRTLSVEAL